MLKLHLGCGDKHIDGFVNIDIRYLPNVDVVDNVRFLRKFENNSVDVIYASHVLEHFSRWEYKSVLKRWNELLVFGGILRLAVPDFEAACKHYLETKQIKNVSGMLYGGQDYQENNHHWCWDFDSLRLDLNNSGFTIVRRYDWRMTEHFNIDDYSQSYVPHMDKETGTLLSLNVEAVK